MTAFEARASSALSDHAKTVENFRYLIARVYPDASRGDYPYYDIRNHMVAVLRSLEHLQEQWFELRQSTDPDAA